MPKFIYKQNDLLLPWAAERIGIPSFAADATAIGIMRNGQISAVVVYDHFSLVDVNMHVASDGSSRWLTREFLTRVFAYPFIQLKLRRVTAMVPADNMRALKFDQRLGFKIEGFHAHGTPTGDLVSLGMLREHCLFIPKEYRQ